MSGDQSNDGRGAVTVERVVVWGLAALAVAGLLALVVGPGADLRTAAPTVDIDSQFDDRTGTVTISHAGGDRLSDTNTRELTVVVTDGDRNTTTTLTWAARDELPVTRGDSFVVDDPRVDANDDGDYLDGDASVGFYLEPGDTVSVRWTGRILGAPSERTSTLASVTVANETG